MCVCVCFCVCVCVCVYVCMCVLYIYIYIYIYIYEVGRGKTERMHVCMYVCKSFVLTILYMQVRVGRKDQIAERCHLKRKGTAALYPKYVCMYDVYMYVRACIVWHSNVTIHYSKKLFQTCAHPIAWPPNAVLSSQKHASTSFSMHVICLCAYIRGYCHIHIHIYMHNSYVDMETH
jgi:hypothetical protein